MEVAWVEVLEMFYEWNAILHSRVIAMEIVSVNIKNLLNAMQSLKA